MKTPMTDLRPCPFCGNNTAPRLVQDVEYQYWEVICSVMRDHGLGCGSRAAHFWTPAEAVELWNSRPNDEAKPTALLEAGGSA